MFENYSPGGIFENYSLGSVFEHYKAFRHVETLLIQDRNLYLAGLLLVGGK